jgi:hypothetical protein
VAAAGILMVVAALGSLAAWCSVLPKISVYQSNPINITDPFSAPFTVFNNGPLTLKSLKFTCVPIDIDDSHLGGRIPSKLRSEILQIERMEAGTKVSVSCNFLQFVGKFSPSEPMTKGQIDIFMEYRPEFVFWKIVRQFRFVTFPASDGKLYWKQSPIPQVWESPDED